MPLLVKWARGEAPVRGRGGLAGLIDVAPTLLARAGAEIPEAMQGRDLARPPAAADGRPAMVFAEEDHEGNVLRAIRTTDWKWIETNPGNPRGLPPRELFHVAGDAGERENLVEREAARAAELRAHADAQQQLARSRAAGAGEAATLSASQEDALRALGYVE